jgi:hypothetical protein
MLPRDCKDEDREVVTGLETEVVGVFDKRNFSERRGGKL